MAIPATLNLEFTRGITYGPLLIYCKNGGNAVDITGWSVFAHVRKDSASPLALNLNPTITTAATGEITIAFTDEQTKQFPPGSYSWDLVMQDPSGERLGPFLAGTVTINSTMTHP
jgi:hypothetical protein